MKISCSWLYAISKYGYPPSLPDTYRALEDMAGLGFTHVELEGVRDENLQAVHGERKALKQRCDDLGLRVVNFCPVLPDLVHPEKARRVQALDLFKLAVEAATFFGCETIQTDSYTPALEFVGDTPYREAISFGKRFQVKVDPAFRLNDLWGWLTDSIGACADEAAMHAALDRVIAIGSSSGTEIARGLLAALRLQLAAGRANAHGPLTAELAA